MKGGYLVLVPGLQDLAKRAWQVAKKANDARIALPEEVKADVISQAEEVLAVFRQRLQAIKKQSRPFNTPTEVSGHWNRNAFFFAVTYKSRSPGAIAPFFKTNVARIEYNADGTFNLGYPMRRGWTSTANRRASLKECLELVRLQTDSLHPNPQPPQLGERCSLPSDARDRTIRGHREVLLVLVVSLGELRK